MKTAAELRSLCAQAKEEMSSIIAGMGEHGELSDANEKKFTELEQRVKDLDRAIVRVDQIDAFTRAAPIRPLRRGQDGDYVTRARRDFSLVRVIASEAGLLRGQDIGLENELMAECRSRAGRPFEGLSVPSEALHTRVMVSGGSGVGLVGTDHMPEQYVDRLYKELITARLGATVLSGLVGNVDIPKNNSSDTSAWVGENVAITAADKSFGSVTLSPKTCGAITEYSRNLLLQSSPDIEMLLRSDLSRDLAVAVDHAAVQGGSPNEPVGVLNYPGIPTTGSSAISWTNIIAALRTVEAANAIVSGWAGSAYTREQAMITPKQTGGVEGNFIMTDPNSLAGYPFYSSQVLRDSGSPEVVALIAGQWSDLLIGYWSGIDILVNPYESTAYSKGNVQVRALITCDVDVRHAESFCVIA